MMFSLVLCTVDRSATVISEFFESLLRQNRNDVEVILVDQNVDDRCVSLVAKYALCFPLLHVRSNELGLSRARNTGLVFAKGELIGFPDDDCVYLDSYLDRVASLFADDANLGGITGCPTASVEDQSSDWKADATPLERFTILNRCQEFTIFIRRAAIGKIQFNVNLGVGSGTLWGADEGPDFLMRITQQNVCIVFYPNLYVYHPDKVRQITSSTLKRSASYARGRGALFRIHQFPLRIIVFGLFRPAGATVLYLLSGNIMRARYYWTIVTGQLRGLFMTSKELEKIFKSV